MVNRMSKHIVYNICKSSILDIDTLIYGCELILSTLLNISFLLVTASLFGKLGEMIIFIVFFAMLRLSAGGYHAPNYVYCIVLYLFMSFRGIFTITCVSNYIVFPYIFVAGIISIILVYKFAPSACENRPLSYEEQEDFKKRSRFIIYILIGIIVVLGIVNYQYALIAMNAVVFESITLVKFKEKGRKEYAQN